MRSENAFGVLCGLAAVFIWSAFIIASRFGVRTHLTPWDIVAIRFAVAGAILLPYLIRRGLALERLGWAGLAAIVIGCGAPCVLLVNVGLLFAPAAHAGALYPGGTPLMVAVLAIVFLGETPSPSKTIGLSLIVLGALCLVFGNGGTIGTQQNLGQALFLAAAFVWGGYTIAMRRAQLDGLHAAAIAAVVSLVLYLPPLPVLQRAEGLVGAGGRANAPGRCAGRADGHRCAPAIRANREHSWRYPRGCVCRLDARGHRDTFDPHARRKALRGRLDIRRHRFCRRVHRRRRSPARENCASQCCIIFGVFARAVVSSAD